MNPQRLVRVFFLAGLMYLLLMLFPVATILNLVLYFGAGFGIFVLLSLLSSFFRFTRLPCAVLNVDGHEAKYRYQQREVKGGVVYQSVRSGDDSSSFTAFSTKEAAFPENVVFTLSISESPLVSATLTVQERTFEFSMNKGRTRCPCPTLIPHWTGTAYAGLFSEEDSEEKWKGAVIFVVRDFGKKRKYPKKKPKLRKKWSWWPRPIFNPT